jgi:hypothetical protein
MNSRSILSLGVVALCAASAGHAQVPVRNPASKIYVADAEGDTQITTGRDIGVLSKKAVYKGEGTIIDTKADSNASIVLSNGTGIYFDVTTRTEIRGFVQAPFRPMRTDLDEEPSISRTNIYLSYGLLGISTSRMAAGSTMRFETSLGTVELHGRQAVIQANDDATIVSIFEGSATVQAGPLGPTYDVRADHQLFIRPGKAGQPGTVEVRETPEGSGVSQRAWLYERVLAADAARRLVYFEMQAASGNAITLFDGDSTGQQIVAIPVVPAEPPVAPTVSAANLFSR